MELRSGTNKAETYKAGHVASRTGKLKIATATAATPGVTLQQVSQVSQASKAIATTMSRHGTNSDSSENDSGEELELIKPPAEKGPLTSKTMATMLNDQNKIINRGFKGIKKTVKDLKISVRARCGELEHKYGNLSYDIALLETEAEDQRLCLVDMLERLETLEKTQGNESREQCNATEAKGVQSHYT